MEAGDDVFAELNEYEQMMGARIPVLEASLPESESEDDEPATEEQGLVEDPSPSDSVLLHEPQPSAKGLQNTKDALFSPAPKMKVALRRNIPYFHEDPSPVLFQAHFGTPNPNSFVSVVEDAPCAPQKSNSNRRDDVLAAMVLCQLSSTASASTKAKEVTTTRPAFSCATTSAFDSFRPQTHSFFRALPASCSSMEVDRDMPPWCYPKILQEQTSIVVTPTAFAEV